MKSKGTCPKCGSTRIIQQVQVIDRSDSGNQSLSLRWGTRALGGWLKVARTHPLDAWACGACGYTELYVRQPAELVAADQPTLQPQAGATGIAGQAGASAGDQARTMIVIAVVLAGVLALGLLSLAAFFLMR